MNRQENYGSKFKLKRRGRSRKKGQLFLGMGWLQWTILTIISFFIIFFLIDHYANKNLPEIIGAVIACLFIPSVIVGVVRFFYFLFKIRMSNKAQKIIFYTVWLISILAQISNNGRHKNALEKKEWIKDCSEIAKKNAPKNVLDKINLEEYCSCAYEKILNGNIKIDSSNSEKFKDVNSSEYNEHIAPCLQFALKDKRNNKKLVSGLFECDTINLLNVSGVSKAKIKLGNDWYYFIWDSGASDIIIPKSIYESLKQSKFINDSCYVGDEVYTLANNSNITCKKYVLNKIQLGNFVVDSSVVAVFNGNAVGLIGNSFMQKFSSWSFYDNQKKLILNK